ncbi:MAG: zinc finger domain-containing protein, partial [Candidatus Acidiferrales bacterium]
DARVKNWERLRVVREEVLKALEPVRAAKTISSGLEARVTLEATGELANLLRKYAANLPGLFIVSQVEIAEGKLEGATDSNALEGLQIRVERAHGAKCDRCWNYSTHVGENPHYPTVCERCVAALEEIERAGGPVNGSEQS